MRVTELWANLQISWENQVQLYLQTVNNNFAARLCELSSCYRLVNININATINCQVESAIKCYNVTFCGSKTLRLVMSRILLGGIDKNLIVCYNGLTKQEGIGKMYTDRNFKTKKQLKEAVASGAKIGVWQPGPFGGNVPDNGTVSVEGPHYPQPHSWYARVTLQNGIIVKVQ